MPPAAFQIIRQLRQQQQQQQAISGYWQVRGTDFGKSYAISSAPSSEYRQAAYQIARDMYKEQYVPEAMQQTFIGAADAAYTAALPKQSSAGRRKSRLPPVQTPRDRSPPSDASRRSSIAR